jgi:uncharacterized protein
LRFVRPTAVLPTVVLRKTSLRWNAPFGPVEARVLTDEELRFLLRRSQGPDPHRAPARHQNKPAAKAEEQAGRWVLWGFFCGAASARASIYACKAFNTEERAGSIGQASGRTSPGSGALSSARAERDSLAAARIRGMSEAIPAAIRNQRYISLGTYRKNGAKIATPVWFGEDANKLYVMTRSDMGKTKRIRNNPQITVAACTIRGKVTGPEFAASARILPPEEHGRAREAINRKYWAARLPLIWRRTDTYLELTVS